MFSNDKFIQFYASSRNEWRKWLKQYSDSSNGIWLIFFKKEVNKPTLTYDESVEEALCFGWIDSLPRKLDDERHMLAFTPRKKRSPWSRVNKKRIEKLLKEGLMENSGLEKIQAAKEDGSWSIADEVEDLLIPNDLQKELNLYTHASKNFNLFDDSSKKGILWWIKSAKTSETRTIRIQKIARMAEKNLKAIYDKE